MKKPPNNNISSLRLLSCPSQNENEQGEQREHQQRRIGAWTQPSSNAVLRRMSVVCLLLLAVTVVPSKVASVLSSSLLFTHATTTEYQTATASSYLRSTSTSSNSNNYNNNADAGFAAIVLQSPRRLQENNSTAAPAENDNNDESTSTVMPTPTPTNNATTAVVYDTEFCNAQCPEPTTWVSALPSWFQIILIIILIMMSALFSGLTLGLMGLDKTGLEIVMSGDDPISAANAKIIYPVRKNGNLLLCTLLLGNVAVNALLSILLADKAGGAVGFISSTFLIVIFGEIIPQAVCSRYALQIGSKTVPLVKVIMFLVYPIAAPLAFGLDKALGSELATTYSSAEMLKMLQIHVQEDVLDKDTAVAMTGALKYKDMTVREVMTPLKNTFMLSVDEKLGFETVAKIFKTGYSRIPVFEVSQNNIIGLLFVKDLIFIDPEDETVIGKFVQIFGRNVHYTWPDEKLDDVLRELRKGKSHLSLVRDVVASDDKDPHYEVCGIITLEDIIEEIIGHEILDETDAFIDGTHEVKVSRTDGFEWAKLRLLGSRIVDEKLSYTETKAVAAHLLTNYPKAVEYLTENQVHRLITDTVVTILPTATRELGKELPNDLLYEKNSPSDVCTLILSGKVTVIAGLDEIRTDVSSWTVVGIGALRDPNYTPDFTAFVCNGPLRCLRITREDFAIALDASASEKKSINEDSFRHLSMELKQSTSNGKAPSELASEYSETGSEGGDILQADRKTKLIAALQVVTGPDVPTQNSMKMLDAVGVGLEVLTISDPTTSAATDAGSKEGKGGEGTSTKVSFAGADDDKNNNSNDDNDPKESAMQSVEESSAAETN